jgi:hypothetical protein
MRPPESSDEALDLIMMAESYYGSLKEVYEENEIFYEGKLEDFIPHPEGYEVTIPVTGRAVVDEATDVVIPEDIQFIYSPRGKGRVSAKAEADADKVRRWLKHLWMHWRWRSSDIDPLRDAARNLFLHGKAVFKLTIDPTLWPVVHTSEEMSPEELELVDEALRVREENNPLVLRSIAPRYIYEDPSVGQRKLWVIEHYQSSAIEIEAMFSQYVPEFRLPPQLYSAGVVPVHEVWTACYIRPDGTYVPGKHWIFVNYRLEYDGENPFYELPYVIKYSGFGVEAYSGDPSRKSVGLLTTQNKSMILAEARRWTQFDAIMTMLAVPVAFLPNTLDVNEISLTPGAVNYVPTEALEYIDKMWVQARIPEAEYLHSLSAISSQIERGTIASVLRGDRPAGVTSGSQLQSLIAQSRIKLDSVRRTLEHMVGQVSSLALRCVDKILQDDVSVFVSDDIEKPFFSIGPDNIKGHYFVAARFVPNEDVIKERKLLIASEAMSKGGMSPYDAYEFAGFENPQEIIARSLAYQVLMSDPIKQYIAQALLTEWGIPYDEKELEHRIKEGQKQVILRDIMNQLQAGSLRDIGVPGAPAGNPAAESAMMMEGEQMPMTPEQMAMMMQGMQSMTGQQQPPSGGTGSVEGIPVPPGRPPAGEESDIMSIMRDINAMRRGG